MDLLERVKELCSKKGISQRKLESEIGLSNGASSKWSKSSPSGEVLQKVADYFDVSTDYILGRTDTKNNDREIPDDFSTPEDAIKFILEKNVIMGFGGFDVNKLSDEEVIEFANELLNQLRLLSYKYKK